MLGDFKLIGVCISKIQNEYQQNCLETLNRYARQKGYHLLIFNAFDDTYYDKVPVNLGEAAIFQLLPYDILDAVILFTATIYSKKITDHIAKNCKEREIPLLTVDRTLEGVDSYHFSFNYADSFEQLCRHVAEKHHIRSAFMIAGQQNNDFSEDRVQAFQKVMREYNVPCSPENVAYGDFWDGPTLDALKNWFEVQKRPVPDAIICANDVMAIATSNYLQDHGYRIPEDCIVTGFDGILQANYHLPHLTTCTQNYDEMGKELISCVDTLFNEKPCEKLHLVNFHPIYSQSCGCQKTSTQNVNHTVRDVLERLVSSGQRQENVCQLQSAVTNMSSIAELPDLIIRNFVFPTITFAVNDDMFRSPEYGESHKGENAFSDNINILYHRTCWNPEEPCTISKAELAAQLEDMLQHDDPIIFCSLHFLDLVMGYCAFQTGINYGEFEKISSFMSSMGTSLGIFHAQMHTKSINIQLKSANSELERLYIHDHMTGLLNRRGFYRQFRQQLQESAGKNLSVILISADLDGLKYINDTFGHIEGDNAITTVGRALMTSAIQGEVCARFGGDEFTVAGIISDPSQTYFESFKTRFRTYLAQYNAVSEKPYQVESSIGYCIKPLSDTIDLDEMSKIADNRMYEDKVKRKKARIR